MHGQQVPVRIDISLLLHGHSLIKPPPGVMPTLPTLDAGSWRNELKTFERLLLNILTQKPLATGAQAYSGLPTPTHDQVEEAICKEMPREAGYKVAAIWMQDLNSPWALVPFNRGTA